MRTRPSKWSIALFGADGLVVVGMNDPDLKRGFIPIITEELIQQRSHELVEATSNQLNEAGFKTQATVPAKSTCFIYEIKSGNVLFLTKDQYQVLNTRIIHLTKPNCSRK